MHCGTSALFEENHSAILYILSVKRQQYLYRSHKFQCSQRARQFAIDRARFNVDDLQQVK